MTSATPGPSPREATAELALAFLAADPRTTPDHLPPAADVERAWTDAATMLPGCADLAAEAADWAAAISRTTPTPRGP